MSLRRTLNSWLGRVLQRIARARYRRGYRFGVSEELQAMVRRAAAKR